MLRSIVALTLLAGAAQLCAEQEYTWWDCHPIHVGGNSIFLGSGSVSKTPAGGNLTFHKIGTYFYVLTPINQNNFFIPKIEWNTFQLHWDKNPKFTQTGYNYLQFALTFYTNSIEKWRWVLRGDYNLDVQHPTNEYGLFSALAWGAYEIWPDWHYHVGVYGYSGMEGSQVYPVIGLDYSPHKKWQFLVVFPIDYYIQYKPDKYWRFSLRGRPLKERFRTGPNEPQPKSVFSYSSIGAELNAKYEIFLRFEAEAYAGYNFGGDFYIKDQNGQNALYTNVGGSPYGGASINYGF